MNEQDLRDCYAMFAMMAVMPVMGGKSIGVGETDNNERFANLCYSLADAMLEARKPKEVGIKTVKRMRKSDNET
jgi:hypothetical protein